MPLIPRARAAVKRTGRWLRHCHVNDTLLPDAFPVRKAAGVGRAKRQGLVQAQNPL